MINSENTMILEKEGDSSSHLRDVCRAFIKMVHNEDPGKASLLDIGCKDSFLKDFFAGLGYLWNGVDINPRVNNVVRGDMHDLPFGSESFSIVFCCHTLEHSENQVRALREMKRVVRDGGFIFVATPAYSDYQIFQCDRAHILVPTMKQMKRLMEQAGIKVCIQSYVKEKDAEDRFASLITVGQG